MSGYYVQTDRLYIGVGEPVWITEEQERDAENSKNSLLAYTMNGERFYWNGETKTMDGAIERATAYPTVAEAESQAFIASCLDPTLAGHLHVIPEATALALEKGRIEARRRDEERAKAHKENRFRLGSREGGI